MRQFEWLWLYGSVWVSALHIPVGVGHRWIHGASTLSCVKWHPVESQGTTFNDIISRAFASAKISVTKEPSGLFRSDGKRPDGLTLIPWHGMLQSLPRWKMPTFRPLHPQLAPQPRWRSPWKQAKYTSHCQGRTLYSRLLWKLWAQSTNRLCSS